MNTPDNGDRPSEVPSAIVSLVEEYSDAINNDQFSDAEVASDELMTLVVELAMKDPKPDPHLLLDFEAMQAEAVGDWPAAEAAYRRQLDRALAENALLDQARSWRNLSKLSALLGNDVAALEYARNGLQAGESVDIGLFQAMLLEAVAVAELKLENPSACLSTIAGALSRVEKEKQFDFSRAKLTITRAEALLAGGDEHNAMEALSAASEPITKQCVMPHAAGVHAAAAHWWEVKAKLAMTADEPVSVLKAWSNAVAFRRHVAGLPQCTGPYSQASLANTLAKHAEAARECCEAQLADELDTESRSIRIAAGLSSR
jgi:hypothetical protein